MSTKLANVYYNLATMLDAGLPIVRSLKAATQNTPFKIKHTFQDITLQVEKGQPLADAMKNHKKIFSPIDITIIEAAENSGSLPKAFKMLASWNHFTDYKIIKPIRMGLIWPAITLLVAAFFPSLPHLVLGNITLNQYLISSFMVLGFFVVPAVLIIAIFKFTPPTGPLRKLLDCITLKIPTLGKAVYYLAISRFCWIFHMLFKAGVPISHTLKLASSNTSNYSVTALFLPAVDAVRNGAQPSEAFSQRLPSEFLNIWQTGEETGNLDDISKKLAENYAERAELHFKAFAAWLLRLVMFLIILFTAFIIIRFVLGYLSQIGNLMNNF